MMTKIFIGIDVGGTRIKGGLVSESGEILHKTNKETGAENGPAHIKAGITETTMELMQEAEEKGLGISGIGLGTAGIVDDKGIVRLPPNYPDWKEEDIAGLLRSCSGLPARVENDANAAAVAEKRFGAGRNLTDFIVLTLGTGVGAGIYLNNRLYKGTAFAAGEAGHIIVFPDGKKCNCGACGCLERYVGRDGIIERGREAAAADKSSLIHKYLDKNDPSLSPEIIFQLADKGDAAATLTLRETGRILGIATATLMNMLNLQAVILAGGIAEAGDFILKPMKQSFDKLALPIVKKHCVLTRAAMKKDTGILGAAAIAMDC